MKKNEVTVGVIPAKKIAPAAPITERFFRSAGKVWIEVYGDVMVPSKDGTKAHPGFWSDGCEKRHLKLLLRSLRERAEEKNIEWTEENMQKRLKAFLLSAWNDQFVGNNFMIRIINVNKTKIFNNQITPKKNGNNYQRSVGEKPIPTANPKRSVGKL